MSQIRKHENSVRVLVIDDQPDRSIETVIVEGAEVHRNPVNGLTNAWEFGRSLADDDVMIFLNNDVVCHDSFAHHLAKAADGTIAGVRWRRETKIGQHAHLLPGGADSLWLEGWCFAVHPNVFHVVGGFDPSMSLYFSDLDLQLRCRVRHKELAFFDKAPLQHIGHATTRSVPHRSASWGRDRDAFIAKNWG